MMYLSKERSSPVNPQPKSATIERLNERHHTQWDDYVVNHARGSFFHLSKWQIFFEKILNLETIFLYLQENGKISGILPLARIKSRLFSDALISIPFGVGGGVLANDQQSQDLLLYEAQELAKQLEVDYLELRQSHDDVQVGYGQSQYVSFQRALSAIEEDNLKAIPRKQRAMVRKAMKQGLTFKIESTLDNFYPLYSESLRNLGTPVLAKSHYQALKDVWGEHLDVLTVYHQDKPLASVMSFYFQGIVLPFYGGGGALAKNFSANDFMYWSLMKHAAERGCHTFDFGRSKIDSGSYRFKKHWGFEAAPLHYRYLPIKKNEKPNISPTNPKYQAFVKIWQQLPLWAANSLGPFIARKIG